MTVRIFHCNELSMVCTQDLSLIRVAMCPTQDLWTSIHQLKKKKKRWVCVTWWLSLSWLTSHNPSNEKAWENDKFLIRFNKTFFFCTTLDHAWMGHYQIFKSSKWNLRGHGLIIAFLRLLFKLSYIIAALIDVRIWCQTWSS